MQNLPGFVVLSNGRQCACVKQHCSPSHCFSLRYLIFYTHTFHVGGHIPWPGSRPDFTRTSFCGIVSIQNCLTALQNLRIISRTHCFGSITFWFGLCRTAVCSGPLIHPLYDENGELVIIDRERNVLIRPTLCPPQILSLCGENPACQPHEMRRGLQKWYCSYW